MSRLSRWLLLAAACCWLTVCRGQLGISPEDMQAAVNSLSASFTDIRNNGLGVDLVEAALRGASYTSDTLTDEEVNNLLSDSTLADGVNSVLTVFDALSAAANGTLSTTTSVPSCCAQDVGSSSLCAYTPSGVGIPEDFTQTLNSASLPEGGVVMVGGTEGYVLQTPSPSEASEDCVEETPDSRLEPWFVSGSLGSSNPREVVIILDSIVPGRVFDGVLPRVQEAAALILNSLSPDDQVGMIGVDSEPRIPSVIDRLTSGAPSVIPVCSDTLSQLQSFVNSFTPTTDFSSPPDYLGAFQRAYGLFSTSNAEKFLLYLTVGASISDDSERSDIQNVVNTFSSNVTVTVYRGGGIDGRFADFGRLVPLSEGQPLSNLVGDFYTLPDTFTRDDSVLIGHANPTGTENGNSLTLQRSLYNSLDELVGVAYAVLPFSQLLRGIYAETNPRAHSYPFVVRDEGRLPLLHPLFPGDSTEDVLITDLEPEGVIGSLLDSNSNEPEAVQKEYFIFTGSTDDRSYARRQLPSTIRCRGVSFQGSVGGVSLCLVLADEEMTMQSLNPDSVDVSAMYRSLQPPVYHDVRHSVAASQHCNYYCKRSVLTRVSFQLTPPTMPPAGYGPDLIDDLVEYIEGGGNAPNFLGARPVAEELAVLLSEGVSGVWLNFTSRPSDYITRRHLATPNGLYLTHPAAHLNENFTPLLTEWYRSPLARPSLLTVAPPYANPLREGGKLSVSIGYAIRAPTTQGDTDLGDGGSPIAVVSGDITVDSLRVFLRQALPACEERGRECIIVDDTGSLVYERDLENFEDSNGDVVARFFGRDDQRMRIVVSNLTGLATKRQCIELFNVRYSTRRFYTLDTSNNDLLRSPPGHCAEFMVQHIPETNLFLVAMETDDECIGSVICNCGETCLNCERFSEFCECPCNCRDDCQDPQGISVCPIVTPQDPMFERVIAEEITTATSPAVPFCFDQMCSCRTDFDSCLGVRDCHWCERERKCAHMTECCSLEDGKSCCALEEEERLLVFRDTCGVFPTECFKSPSRNTTCPLTEPPPTSSNTSAIVGAVVGALLGVLLIGIIIVLIIYYQVFRKADPDEESSRESAFDFSNKTALGNSSGSGGKTKKGSKAGSKSNSEGDAEKAPEKEKEATPPKEKDETTTL